MASGGTKDRVTKTSSNPSQADRERSVLLIGHTGHGKSSLGNTILGSKTFKVGRGMHDCTTQTQIASDIVLGRRLKVIDTAGFTGENVKDKAAGHVADWKKATSSNPDVIVQVVRFKSIYATEHTVYQEIVKAWGEPSLFLRRLMVVITHNEELGDEDVEEKLWDEGMRWLLRDARKRFVTVNIKESDAKKKDEQRTKFCNVMDNVIKDDEKIASSSKIEDVAVVLVGKTGQGKSRLGNLLAWTLPTTRTKGTFPESLGMAPFTQAASEVWADKWVSHYNIKFKVIDTPYIHTLDEKQKEEEVRRWKEMTQGLRVIMALVVRSDVRLTSEELAVYRDVKNLWGDSDYKVMVVFTFRDRVVNHLQKELEWCKALKELMEDVGYEYVLINNKDDLRADKDEDCALKVVSLIKDRVRGMATKGTA